MKLSGRSEIEEEEKTCPWISPQTTTGLWTGTTFPSSIKISLTLSHKAWIKIKIGWSGGKENKSNDLQIIFWEVLTMLGQLDPFINVHRHRTGNFVRKIIAIRYKRSVCLKTTNTQIKKRIFLLKIKGNRLLKSSVISVNGATRQKARSFQTCKSLIIDIFPFNAVWLGRIFSHGLRFYLQHEVVFCDSPAFWIELVRSLMSSNLHAYPTFFSLPPNWRSCPKSRKKLKQSGKRAKPLKSMLLTFVDNSIFHL